MSDWQQSYSTWQATGSPDDLHATVSALHPVLQRSVASIGAAGDQSVMAKAKLLAAGAVKSYSTDHGANLPTWVAHQLTPLRRFKRLGDQTLAVPERMQLDALNIEKARRVFVDKFQRDPDQIELSDAAQLSQKRIREVRKSQFVMPGDNSMEGGTSPLNTHLPDYTDEALDYIYQQGDAVDRAIMEGKMGYNGAQTLSTGDLLRKTKLSPFQLTRRAAALAMRTQKIMDGLEGGGR